MIGVDIGMNVASVVKVSRSGKILTTRIIKSSKDFETPWDKIVHMSIQISRAVQKIGQANTLGQISSRVIVAIEEPIYSWGRKNPKGFGSSMMLFALIRRSLEKGSDCLVIPINPKVAKKKAGSGKADKAFMIGAACIRSKTKIEDMHPTKYGRETIADSYWIAMAAFDLIPKSKTPKT